MDLSRRKFFRLAAMGAGVAAFFGFASKANALVEQSKPLTTAINVPPISKSWTALLHATDGTDPSTSVQALPKFTPDIRAMEGKQVSLEGYVQMSGAIGVREYLLSAVPLHCMFCYPAGRASLAVVHTDAHVEDTTKRVRVTGTLKLQETDPSDFYYTLEKSEITFV
jgi:hypothetical protein